MSLVRTIAIPAAHCAFAALMVLFATAAQPSLVLAWPAVSNYQGYLTNASGPVTGAVDVEFRIYDDLTAGTQLWSETHAAVPVIDGVFTVLLGTGVAGSAGNVLDATLFDGTERYLEVVVGTDVLWPRRRFTSTGYALRAQTANFANGLTVPAVLIGSGTGGYTVLAWNDAATGATVAVQARVDSPDGTAVQGIASDLSGASVGVLGESASSQGTGVVGKVTSNSGNGYGVYGETQATAGGGVYGSAPATTGATYGVLGVSGSSAGRGVYGFAESATGQSIGVLGRTESIAGIGVSGYATAPSGATVGVLGQAASPTGIGVDGVNTAVGGDAVRGRSSAATGSGIGVVGISAGDTGTGVYGEASTTTTTAGNTPIGVHGYAPSPVGWAGYFDGHTGVTGNLIVNGATTLKGNVIIEGTLDATGTAAAAVKNFVQPHPGDASKEIVYISAEAPEAVVFLRGEAVLRDGQAVIELPAHFRAVAAAQGVQVQLTPYSAATHGLAAIERSNERIVVAELAQGRGSFAFGYVVTATRAGFEQHRPVVENTRFRPRPDESAAAFERRFAGDSVSSGALRAAMIANGLLTPDGRLNRETLRRLGWDEPRAEEVAQRRPLLPQNAR